MVLSNPLMADVIPEGQHTWSVFGCPLYLLGFLPQPSALLLKRKTEPTWKIFKTYSTRITKAGRSSTLIPSLMVVSPAVIASSEWFLYAPSSGARASGPAAHHLCSWLYNNLQTLLSSVTHAATLLKFHNLPTQLDEFCPDLALYIRC